MSADGRTPIFVFGAGGHGRSVRAALQRGQRYRIAAILDDDPNLARADEDLFVGGREALGNLRENGIEGGVIAIGDNETRDLLASLADQYGFELATVIDPSAVVAADAVIGPGTVVMATTVVNTGAVVGGNVILNTGCSVDHDCSIGDFAHLSPGVRLSGECVVKAHAHLGIGSCVVQRVRIGEGARIGAGAAVLEDVAAGTTVVGVPARIATPRES